MCKDVEVKCLKNIDYQLNSCNSDCNQFSNYLINVQKLTDLYGLECEENEEGKAVYV